MSNANWSKKRAALSEHSVLLMNHRLVNANPEVWDEAVIDERSSDLAKRVARLWPGPDVSLETWRTTHEA
jgi:hypothetical protein